MVDVIMSRIFLAELALTAISYQNIGANDSVPVNRV